MSLLEVDFHTHLMPGVDDGSRSPVETIAMARGLAELGVACVCLTPHQYKLGNRLDPLDVRRRADAVWRVLARAEIPLEVRAGAEYNYGEELLDAVSAGADLIACPFGDDRCVLVELPETQPAVGVEQIGRALVRRGYRPVLAHPERVRGLGRELDRVDAWKRAGWSLQLNLLSLVGRHGGEAEAVAHRLLEDDLYDFAGSDLHRPSQLEALGRAHERLRSLTAPTGAMQT